ncbi:MAG TPA: response regulator [Opitutales bacterium]|jgi:two-component system cell cycle sensor histidine kinase/response regulator CckA|nr:response regulator [Opitutales bacterium]
MSSAPPPTSESPARAAAPAARILIVEDDPSSAFILQKIIARGHYDITGLASSGAQACQLVRDKRPDLLLMDINISGDMDGIETAEKILREHDLPLIYLTAFSDQGTIDRARRTRPFAYLLKPYREKEVIITIEMALYKSRLDRVGKATEQRLAATLGALQDYVLTTDSTGLLTYLNPAAEHVLGRTAKECVGRPLAELLDLRERETHTKLPEIAERILQAGFHTEPTHPLALASAEGETVLVQVQTNALAEPDGTAMGRVVILRDVTQLDQLEENIRRAQKLEAVGRLAGGISHDFNNLLAIINSYADLLLLKGKSGDPLEKYYRNIRAAGQRGADLVARMMTFSRRVSSPSQVVNPADVVREVEKMMRPVIREDIELIVDAPPGLPQLYTDAGQIEQVLVNLCLNARDAIADAGRITISLAEHKFDSLEAARRGLHGPGSYILLSVADTGCGIPLEIREKIFEPFFTTKEVGKGSGLGLAMVYSLVKQNRGRIDVTSELDKGTVFTITLPALIAKPVTTVVREDGPRNTPGGSERVLLVEDDPNFSDCIKNLLDMHGYTTIAAGNGEEALEIFRANHGNFDLLMTDIVLPKLSGHALVGHLRTQRPGLRVLYMSGYEALGGVDKDDPNTDRLQKPFSLNTLLERVRRLLDGQAKTKSAELVELDVTDNLKEIPQPAGVSSTVSKP